MVYLFLINYARAKPEMVQHALPGLLEVTSRLDARSMKIMGTESASFCCQTGRVRPECSDQSACYSNDELYCSARGAQGAR